MSIAKLISAWLEPDDIETCLLPHDQPRASIAVSPLVIKQGRQGVMLGFYWLATASPLRFLKSTAVSSATFAATLSILPHSNCFTNSVFSKTSSNCRTTS
jgi:hypothetical protein